MPFVGYYRKAKSLMWLSESVQIESLNHPGRRNGQSVKHHLLALVFACAIGMAMAHVTQAAELRLTVMGPHASLDIEGVIAPGDYERFLGIAKKNQGRLFEVNIYSPGGNFLEAIKIGRALRALEISSQVPMQRRDGHANCEGSSISAPRNPENCIAASAAFFIHVGAVHRGGTYLEVHRPYFDPSQFRSLSQSEAEVAYTKLLETAKDYMNEMAVPRHIQEVVFNTPSNKTVLLDEKTVRTHIWGDLPHRYEWRRAKCGRMTFQQAQRYEQLNRKLRLAAQEKEEWGMLNELSRQEGKCGIALDVESRRAAYTKFFGIAPSD